MKTCFHSLFYANFHTSATLVPLFGVSGKFSPKCRAGKLGLIHTILGGFRSFLNWEGAEIQPLIWLRKFSDNLFVLEGHYKSHCTLTNSVYI